MWNSEEQADESSSQVEEMSSVLNVSPDHMQQFMSGNMSIQSLAALAPTPSTSFEVANDELSHIHSNSWTNLQNSSIFSQSPSPFESSAFTGILSGSTPATQINQVSTPTAKSSDDAPFRSPTLASDRTTLMELSTVTPTRIKNSPTGIITKKLLQSQSSVEDVAPFISTQLQEQMSSDVDLQQPDNPDLSNQFRIVIGGDDSENHPSTSTSYFVDLESVSKGVATTTTNPDSGLASTSKNSIANPVYSDIENSDAELASSIQHDLNLNVDLLKESRKRAKKGVVSKLPKELRGLMGEANLCYARGGHDDAIKMCMEVVRLAPYAGEPFETLAMIYDEKGQTERSLQYSLLAAHLSCTDAMQWLHLAEMCVNQGDDVKALDCYMKAAKLRSTDHNIFIECGKLQQKLGIINKAMQHYKSAIEVMPANEGEQACKLAREMSKICHEHKENALGIALLEQAFEKHLAHFKDQDANLLCELYLFEKQYTSVFKVLEKHSSLEVIFEDSYSDTDDFGGISEVAIPGSMPVDLQCKAAIAGIRLDKCEAISEIVQSICSHDPSDVGDLQFELAETYMSVSKYTDALVILDILVASRDYGLAAVWLRHAECHRARADIDKALQSYRNCVRMAPGHVEAHLLFSKTLREVEKFHEAVQTLELAENYEIDTKDHMRLYHERYTVLKMWGEQSKQRRIKLSLAADTALMMFTNRFRQTAFREGRIILVRRSNSARSPMLGEFKLLRQRIGHLYGDGKEHVFSFTDLYLKGDCDIFTKEEWLVLFNEAIVLLMRCHRYRDAINLGEGLQYCTRWCDHLPTRQQFERVTFCACMLSKNYQRAYTIISPWLRANLDSNHLWNVFNQLIAKTEDQRHQKFCLRLLLKNPANLALVIMTANNWMSSGHYKTAVGEYLYAHKQVPTEPLYLMMLGVAFTNLTSQKFTDYKHSFVTQALAYFQKYLEARGFTQECYYNIGRAMHQLGLEHFALHYYEKAMDCPVPALSSTGPDQLDNSVFDLRREIAFNLSLIYRRSGNTDQANAVLCKHCVV